MAASGGKKRNADSTESLAFLNREPRTSVYVFSHLQAYIHALPRGSLRIRLGSDWEVLIAKPFFFKRSAVSVLITWWSNAHTQSYGKTQIPTHPLHQNRAHQFWESGQLTSGNRNNIGLLHLLQNSIRKCLVIPCHKQISWIWLFQVNTLGAKLWDNLSGNCTLMTFPEANGRLILWHICKSWKYFPSILK